LAALGSSAASLPSTAEIEVSVSGLRNTDGAVLLCLTRRADAEYLKCANDPSRTTRVVPTAELKTIKFRGIPAGDYALLVIHDENRNGKLDTMFGMPREGFGFSRNPMIRMGPPAYRDVQFAVTGSSQQSVKLKYLL